MGKKRRFLKLQIEKVVPGGYGLARNNGYVIFVPYSVPGDRVKVELEKIKKDYAIGKILDIIEPSPDRVIPACPLFPRCGGCQWQMMSYEAQLRHKINLIKEAFEKIGKMSEIPLLQIEGMHSPWGFRNKVILPLKRLKGRVIMGFYSVGTHKIVDMDTCPIQLPQFNALIEPFKKLIEREPVTIYNELKHRGKLRNLVLRGSEKTGETLVILVMKDHGLSVNLARKIEELDRERIIGVVENINREKTNIILGKESRKVTGRDYYYEKALGLTFKVSALSFFQTNLEMAERLLSFMLEITDEYRTVVDAYSGVGLFSLHFAKKAGSVIGIEESPSSHYDSLDNLEINSIYNVEFIEGKVENVLPTIKMPELLIVDPPRRGLEKEVLREIVERKPREILYVSCNPVTLARDVKRLVESGYKFELLKPFDFFPHTHHIETLAYLTLQ